MRYAFYPGCTQESTAEEYGLSSRAVCRELGIEFEEIPDWSCCGASSGHFLNEELSYTLPARNLALAERMASAGEKLDIAIVCAACYLRLKSTQQRVRNSPEFRRKMEELIGLPYQARCEVRHLLDILVNDLGIEEIRKRVKNPLRGLKLVAYYGCYLVRPPQIVAFDDPENPTSMDTLLETIGVQALDWGGKVDCCGGSLALTRPDVVSKLVEGLIERVGEVGAESIVVACPMCHSNLDTRQGGKAKLPIFYFTELLGLALGLPAKSWLKKHLISPLNLLKSHQLLDYS